MKKTLSLIVVVLLFVGAVMSFASCGEGRLSGKYEGEEVFDFTTFEFDGENVTVTYTIGVSVVINGTYEVGTDEDGRSIITFAFPSTMEGIENFQGVHRFAEGTENGVDYIKIDGIQYNKVN